MSEIEILNTRTASVDPASLLLHEQNPREGDVAAITESFRLLGFWGSVIVDEETLRVLAGNHRVKAALALGMPTVPVQYVKTRSVDHGKQILVADNRSADLATNDAALLVELLREIDLEGTGYDGDDLDHLVSDLNPDWSSGVGGPGTKAKQDAIVRPVFTVTEIRDVEDAITRTGLINRADALLEICRAYKKTTLE